MTEDILISVRGLHTLDIEQEEEETDELEMTMPGKYYFRNGKHYVLFEETDEESQSVVKNRFKLSEDRLEISKKGCDEYDDDLPARREEQQLVRDSGRRCAARH